MSESRDERSVALGVDVGTSGLKAVAIDRSGATVASADRSYPLHTPQPGWTEQDPTDWREAATAALRELMGALGDRPVVGIGLSGQMHGMVALDDDGAVVRPAILWNDQRTDGAVQAIEERIPPETLIQRGGNPAITGFQLPKVVWLREHEPEAFARVRHVLFPKDWIGYGLTGRFATDPSDASGSNAFHLASKQWDEEVLGALDLDPSLFPAVVASDEVVGHVTNEAARSTGLAEGTPVVAGAGDNAAAATALGLSSERPELGSVSLGTSGVIFAPVREPTPDPQGRVHLFCHADGSYHLLGVTLAAAGSMQWLRDTLFPDRSFEELVEHGMESPVGARGVRFLPYLAGERTPHMDPDLRGAWRGLSLATDTRDLVRSVLEGVAFSLRDALEVMRPLCAVERALATGGGARSDPWLGMVADVLELPLSRPGDVPGAAYGAAVLAWRSQGETLTLRHEQGDAFEPAADVRAGYDRAWRDFRGDR